MALLVRCAMHADAFSPKQGCISRSKNPNTESLNHVAKKDCPFSLLHFMSCIIYVLFLLCVKDCFLRKAKGKVSAFKPFHHKTTRPPICQSKPICDIPNHHLLVSRGVSRPRRVGDRQRCLLCRSGMPGRADRTWGPGDQWRL